MNLDQTLHLLQIIVVGGILAVSAWGVWRQLRATHRLHRRDLFATTTDVSEEYYATCLMHWKDHFKEETYRKEYEGNDKRCRSYLLMKRKYMYLVFQWFFKDEFGKAAHRWLTELVNYREFEDVHEFHGHYYGEFSQEVAKYLQPSKPGENMPWFCDDVEPDDSGDTTS